MRIADFELYCDLLRDHSGLTLNADQSFLLDSRLTPVAKKWGYPSLSALTMTLRGMPDPEILKDIIEAMATHDTAFFRDKAGFGLFEKAVMPWLLEHRRKKRNIRIWCTGVAGGQEAYSLAMILRDMEDEISNWRVEILGTDLAEVALEKARKGHYSQFEMQQSLSIETMIRHFDQKDDGWQIKDPLRRMVTFKNFNLMDDMSELGVFDVIFCCNVLDVFDAKAREKVLRNLSDCLKPDGFLFLGKDEAASDAFRPVVKDSSLYVFKDRKFSYSAPAAA